jgi:hypothetical protein
MTFFFSGRTRCAICGQPIEQRAEATELPYVDPRLAPELAAIAGRFAHRRCWSEWPEAGGFAQQAYELARAGSAGDATVETVFAGEGLLVLLVRATQAWLWQDFVLAVRLEIPVARIADVARALETGAETVLQVGPLDWHVRAQAQGAGVELRRDGEPLERFVVPASRLRLWRSVLQTAPVVPPVPE